MIPDERKQSSVQVNMLDHRSSLAAHGVFLDPARGLSSSSSVSDQGPVPGIFLKFTSK